MRTIAAGKSFTFNSRKGCIDSFQGSAYSAWCANANNLINKFRSTVFNSLVVIEVVAFKSKRCKMNALLSLKKLNANSSKVSFMYRIIEQF